MSSTSAQTMSTAAEQTPPLSFRLQPESRQVLTRKRARELLTPLSESAYTSISLGGCALGDAAAGIAGTALVALAKKKCLRSVTLADCIASLSQDEALRSLSTLATSIGMWKGLISVDLSYNALGSRGVAACAPLLQGQRKLEELYLIESGLAAESVRLLQGYLCMGPETKLRTLHVHANRLESKGLNHLSTIVAKSPSLESLRLSSLGAAGPAVKAVAAALKGKSALRELDLSDNLLDVDAAQELASVIPELPNLERLILRDLDMGDEALSVILAALSENPSSIYELALSGNELAQGAGPALAVFLRSCPDTLRILDLSRNELEEGAGEIADALEEATEGEKKPVLTHLILGANEIPPLTVLKIALKLLSFPALQCFDVSGNQMPENVKEALCSAIGAHVVVCDGLETIDDGVPSEQVAEEDDVELGQALRELASAPSVVPKAPADGKRDADEQVKGDASSSQSRSAVSRLVSLFSRGTNSNGNGKDNEKNSANPSNEVIVEDSGPIDSKEDDEIQANGESVQDESEGAQAEEQASTTEPREEREFTVTTGVTAESRERSGEKSPSTPVQRVSNANVEVIQSAKKLKESIVSLSKEIAQVAGELQIPATTEGTTSREGTYSGMERNTESMRETVRELLGGDLPTERTKSSGMIVEMVGGLLVAMFVVILVLGIAQSQEESTFTYRLV